MSTQIGIFENVSWEEYASIDALNGSSLVHMRRSPMYYRFMRDNPTPATQAQMQGIYNHRMILEPGRIGDFAVWGLLEEEKVRNGKVWENFKRLNEGATIITRSERDTMVGISVAVRKSRPMSKYLRAEGPTELTLVWEDPDYKRLFKGRLDKWIPSMRTIFDLKQARSCEPYRFGGQAYALNYHIKAAIYCSGVRTLFKKEPKFVFGAVEPKQPHESAVYRATKDVLLQGALDWQEIMTQLAECERTNTWPPSQAEETDLTLPPYAYSDADELADLTYTGD